MTSNQKKVLAYLRTHPNTAVSPTEVGGVVGGGIRHSSWGSPICKQLVKLGLVTRTKSGHYMAK